MNNNIALMKINISYFFALILLLSCNNQTKETKKENAPILGCFSSITSDKNWYSETSKAPKFNGLDGINFNITTSNQEAQYYFNQGMMLAYGFNHAEAARSFYQAIRLDTTCAMAYWGFAYVLGPNYNGGMEADNFQRAYDAVLQAQKHAQKCTPKEKDLIHALSTRYIQQPSSDRSALDKAYALAMQQVYKQYTSDPDIGTLYAEAIMDMHPWDLYDKKTKKPKEWTYELVDILQGILKNNPTHAGAHHFYIHSLETSATPEKALESAHLLNTLVPAAGHLLHMPSHIYINTGDYHLGSIANLKAIEADSIYTTTCHAQGIYPLSYYPHNYHFLVATATLEGNTALAWRTALQLQEHTAKEIMHLIEWGTLQHYYSIPYYVAVKLSMWDTILALNPPPKELTYPNAIWHFAKGMAYLGKNQVPLANSELQQLNALASDTMLTKITIWNINTTNDLVQIAQQLLAAGIAAKQSNLHQAIVLLKQAVNNEDNLNYNEPPDWFFSIRHHLGAALLKAGNHQEAELVYQKDLETWKKNGWALIGLYNALKLQGKNAAANTCQSMFNESWKYADVAIHSSSNIID
jgi:hypothetical protein